MNPEEVAKKLDSRPGYSIVNYMEVALPVFKMTALLTLQERSKIGPIEETILKTINVGMGDIESIVGFIGLPPDIVKKQIGALVYESVLRLDSDVGNTYKLSEKGKNRLHDAKVVSVNQEEYPIYIDGMTREVIVVEYHELYIASQIDELGIAVMLPSPRKAPNKTEILATDINKMLDAISSEMRAKQRVLRIDGFTNRSRLLFRRAVALAYKSDNGRNMIVSFAFDGRLSESHENSFIRSKDRSRTLIFKQLYDSSRRRRGVQEVMRHIKDKLPDVAVRLDEMVVDKRKRILRLNKKVEEKNPINVQLVKLMHVYEHPPLLDKAFTNATKRILIISPWIREKVVDKLFIKKLTNCLDKGVDVKIYYGIGKIDKDERRSDVLAREALESLDKSFKNFSLVRKGNTHAKVLLVDSKYFVTTSFNWLSFKGDPNKPFREEWGTYVEGDDVVNSYYMDLTKD